MKTKQEQSWSKREQLIQEQLIIDSLSSPLFQIPDFYQQNASN